MNKTGKTTWTWKDDIDCTDIYRATVLALEGTPCKVSPEMCGRYAILVDIFCLYFLPLNSSQRRAYKIDQGRDFWLQVDILIENFRKKGMYKKSAVAKYTSFICLCLDCAYSM